MSNHRPKSLSELNNVYDKALRAEKAIKEGSTLLSTPETKAVESENNIFRQLETKAAEVQKNQVFDPDITNIANDFLKRYAQPEKPKKAPTEIKRPAPTIQSVQHHVRKTRAAAKPEATPLDTAENKPVSVPLHRPSSVVPPTESVIERKPEPAPVVEAAPVVAEAPEVIAEPAPVAEAPAVKTPETAPSAPVRRQRPVRTTAAPRIDHTPKPAHSRRRISSTERSELMEEYLRVMSDEDDEPSEKKSVFSFFKKKKSDDYDEPVESIYEDFSEEEANEDEEVPVVAFDHSDVKYDDAYSQLPDDEDSAVTSAPMNLYDYIEADFDYDEEDDDDDTLDISTTTFEKEEVESYYGEDESISEEKAPAEVSDDEVYPAETVSDALPEEAVAETAEEIIEAEEIIVAEEIVEAEEIIEAQEVIEAEEVIEAVEIIEENEVASEEIIPEEEIAATQRIDIAEVSAEAEEIIENPEESAVYEEETAEAEEVIEAIEEAEDFAPPAEMVFEDIFSVSDENKRSHTGGDWVGAAAAAVAMETDYSEADDSYDSYDEYDEEDYDFDDDDDYDDKKGTNIFLKVVMIFFALVSLTIGGATIAADMLLDIDSGNLVYDSYRLFSADEDMPSFGIDKGDLIITNNVYAHTDDVYVFLNDDDTFGVGKVVSNTSTALGEYLNITQTETDTMHVNRDKSLGVVVGTYGTLGTVLSIICSYGIFIAIFFILVAVGLIVLLIVISKRKADDSRYDEYDEDYRPDNDDSDDENYSDNDSDEDYDDEEYYSEYDTDGIEQGLFTGI